MSDVSIIDYGASNMLSLYRSVAKAGGKPVVLSDPSKLSNAERVIIPGVGAFKTCSDAFTSMGWKYALADYLTCERPLLGVCVGMQLMFDFSLEFGRHPGLGLFSGHVERIPNFSESRGRRVPHVGWSTLHKPANRTDWAGTLLQDTVVGQDSVYFVHSFACQPSDPACKLAVVDYHGFEICAAVESDNITAFQFHPEKSGEVGLRMLSRFLG
ncbi:imidazole glycerol phosphate synthase subunit HisH [Sphingomonas lacunae]|uniref:Imidazole glycerol phosphate synthase subunit HisH n=1 Tax=Sphingomonas lacunae TaxID=2698828 RepID=A0A6M4AXM2_9SPHN|nr:imidazole glycerol phosphate synthase subunit HisH [Sphingomonas lacunae]QJQ32769.1 imidazole glycerol phosphate synthase subunit HisH [Sphingomonas lacunae]